MTTAKTKFILRLMQLERKLKKGYMVHVSSWGNNVTLAINKQGDTEPLVSVFCTPKAYVTTEEQLRTIFEIETRQGWKQFFK